MFQNSNRDYANMDTKQLLILLLEDVDEVKRYVANIHVNTDSEVGEIRDYVRKVEQQLQQTDRQVDRIERFERELGDIKSLLRNLERKIR